MVKLKTCVYPKKMEAEKDEDNKAPVFRNIIYTVGFLAVCCCLPVIINFVHPAIAWFKWFIRVVTYIFGFGFLTTLAAWIYFANANPKPTEEKEKRGLYDTYFTADHTPAAVHQPAMGYVTEVRDYNNVGGNYNKEMVEAYEEVETFKAVKESNCYGRVEVEEVNSRSYRRTRSSMEKKTGKQARFVDYRRTESERVAKTASRRSRSQTTMNELSNEEFRATVESFIMEKKMILQWQNGVADPLQNGVHHWQNGVPQLQNGVGDYWQNGVPQLQNGAMDQWQNGGVDQWQNGVSQWQGLPYDDGRRHHRNRRLVGGSGSNGSGPYLAISN